MSTAAVNACLADIDRCWIERRFDDLRRYLADDVVYVPPGGAARLSGWRAAVESYREFMAEAEINDYQVSGQTVTMDGETAVVERDWTMAWRSRDQSHTAAGRDVMVLGRRAGDWRVVWRMQLPAA